LIRTARPLYADEDLGRDLDNAVYALDASTIDLRLSVFPWALFRSTESAVKLQTLLDLQGNIPTFIHISDGKLHDVNVLDLLIPEPGAFYIMDRGYVDFERLFTLHRTGRFFRTIALSGVKSVRDYPQPLRRIRYHDVQTSKTFNFLTNNFAIPAQTVADLYRYRWQVELFFKWIKQHLRIKSFFGTSENAVKSQIWIAIPVYILVAIIKKRLDSKSDFYTILQILSLTLFENILLALLVTRMESGGDTAYSHNRLNLFDNSPRTVVVNPENPVNPVLLKYCDERSDER